MKNTENQGEKNSEKLTRLITILNVLGYDKDKDFAEAIGKSKAYVSQIKSTALIPKTLGQILEDKLGINRYWFETGLGEMRIDGDSVKKNEQPTLIESELENLKATNFELRERIGELKYTVALQKKQIAFLEERCAPKKAVSH